MSYKNDHALTIANKYGSASSAAKAELYETYDKLRDLTVSGFASTGSGFGAVGGFLWQLASLFAPSQFMSVLGGSNQGYNIPGTSYWTPYTGATSSVQSATSSFGTSGLGSYSGFPSGAASVLMGLGTYGSLTGGASSIASGYSTSYIPSYVNSLFSTPNGTATGGASGVLTGGATSAAGIAGLNTAAYAAGTGAGLGIGQNILMPLAGIISGWGGVMQSLAPYLGEYGLGAIVLGNLMQGTGNAAVGAYSSVSGQVLSNADTILSDKVRNIETVCKMLDTQAEAVRKSLKDSIEGDSKLAQSLQ